LLDLGANVAVIDLRLSEEKSQLDQNRCRFFKADVSNTAEVQKAVNEIAEWSLTTQRNIAAVVCCAGFLGPQKVPSRQT
jgi:3-hydroxyacyl-CoA dehydrogenase/3-hydroxy-2-methylbutyryl-CoA dehydrogenase